MRKNCMVIEIHNPKKLILTASFSELVDTYLNLNISPLSSENKINSALAHLNYAIVLKAEMSTPTHAQKSKSIFRLPVYIKEKISTRRRLRKLWEIAKYPAHKTPHIKHNYKNAWKILDRQVRIAHPKIILRKDLHK